MLLVYFTGETFILPIFNIFFFIFKAFSSQIWVVLLVMMYVYLYIIYGLKF